MQVPKRKISGTVLFLCCMAIVLYSVMTAASIWQYGKVDEKCRADAAIILGAGAYEGTISPVFKERMNHGIWLYQNNYVKKLILTGGYGKGNSYSDAYAAKLYAESLGIPTVDILLEEQSTITQENISYAKKIMEREKLRSAVIVSDPLHMKRAMRMAKDAGIKAYSSPTPTTRYISLKSKLPFLAREVFFYTGYLVFRRI